MKPKQPTIENQIAALKADLKKATEFNDKIKGAQLSINGLKSEIRMNEKIIESHQKENELMRDLILNREKVTCLEFKNTDLIQLNIDELNKKLSVS